jgi:hypothetical protein
VQDTRGYTALEPDKINMFETVTRALGFEPPAIARLKQKRNVYYQKKGSRSADRDELMEDFANAQRTKDYDARDDAIKAIRAWNKAHREAPITRQSLLTSYKSRVKQEYNVEQYGVNAGNRADRSLVREIEQRY